MGSEQVSSSTDPPVASTPQEDGGGSVLPLLLGLAGVTALGGGAVAIKRKSRQSLPATGGTSTPTTPEDGTLKVASPT